MYGFLRETKGTARKMSDAAKESADPSELLCATCPANTGEGDTDGEGELLRRCEVLAARIAAHLEQLQQAQGAGPTPATEPRARRANI